MKKPASDGRNNGIASVAILFALLLSSCGGGSGGGSGGGTQPTEPLFEKLTARQSNISCFAVAIAPAKLSDTGCFTNTATQELSGGAMFYTVNNLLWSDDEKKGRYFTIPDTETIALDPDGEFIFPVGSVLIKNFEKAGIRIETRFLMRIASTDSDEFDFKDDGWVGYSYEWNAAQTDADLVPANVSKVVNGHLFPSEEQCMECHTKKINTAIGNETLQQNYNMNYTNGETENYLDMLDRLDFLAQPLDPAFKLQHLFAIDDDQASIEQRARSYLHTNCSGCHRPGASEGGYRDFRFNASAAAMGCRLDVNATDNLGVPNPKVIDPRNAANSAIFLRINTNDSFQMPPLGRSSIDDAAANVIGQWIDGLDDCGF